MEHINTMSDDDETQESVSRVIAERIATTVGELKEETRIQKPYNYHKPSAAGLETITRLRKAYSDLDDLVKALAPHSRERSEAITCLETSAMWAIKSVVVNDPESEVA